MMVNTLIDFTQHLKIQIFKKKDKNKTFNQNEAYNSDGLTATFFFFFTFFCQ